MGMVGGSGRVYEQEGMKGCHESSWKMKNRKKIGADFIMTDAEIWRRVIQWMLIIWGVAWKEWKVPERWTEAIIIPVYKKKGT